MCRKKAKGETNNFFVLLTAFIFLCIFVFYCFMPVAKLDTWGFIFVISVVVVNGYLLLILLRCSALSEFGGGCESIKKVPLPSRNGAFLQLFLLVALLVVCFAGMYRTSDYIEHTAVRAQSPHKQTTIFSVVTDTAESKVEALYFSFVTLTTVGYGDLVPHTLCARLLVMWELGTAMQLLLFAIPMVVGRLTNWSNASWKEISTFDQSKLGTGRLLGAVFVNETPVIIKEMKRTEKGGYQTTTTICRKFKVGGEEKERQHEFTETFTPTHFTVIKTQ